MNFAKRYLLMTDQIDEEIEACADKGAEEPSEAMLKMVRAFKLTEADLDRWEASREDKPLTATMALGMGDVRRYEGRKR